MSQTAGIPGQLTHRSKHVSQHLPRGAVLASANMLQCGGQWTPTGQRLVDLLDHDARWVSLSLLQGKPSRFNTKHLHLFFFLFKISLGSSKTRRQNKLDLLSPVKRLPLWPMSSLAGNEFIKNVCNSGRIKAHEIHQLYRQREVWITWVVCDESHNGQEDGSERERER